MEVEALLRDKIRRAREDFQEDNRERMIVAYSFCENPDDMSIYDLIEQKSQLVRTLCDEFRWKKTRDGYLQYSDYDYDSRTDTITFTTNFIRKVGGGGYLPSKTPAAMRHYADHKQEFALLNEIENKINAVYLRHKDDIDRALEEIDRNIRPSNPIVRDEVCLYPYTSQFMNRIDEANIAKDKNQIRVYFQLYELTGKMVLVQWLNRLNEPGKSVSELVTEFHEYIENNKHLFPKLSVYGPMLEFHLLEAIKAYSVRGRMFEAFCKKHHFDTKKPYEKKDEQQTS